MRILPIIFYILVSSCFSCKNLTWVNIKNQSTFKIDSVVVMLNNKNITFFNIKPNEEVKRSAHIGSIVAPHDVIYIFELFIMDSLIEKQYIFSNDLGYVPPLIKVFITDSLTIIQE